MKFLLAVITAAALLPAAELKLGKPLTAAPRVPIASLLSKPGDYTGKTVQVEGKVKEVCQEMGCWMQLVDASGNAVRIKVNDGEIVFPKDSPGKTARAEGVFTRIDLTLEQARAAAEEEARDSGKKFNPDSVKSGTTIYQIKGSGAIILD